MNLDSLRIKTRLLFGFGTLVMILAAAIGLAEMRFFSLGTNTRATAERDLPMALHANTIDTLARDDARHTLTLFVLEERGARARSYEAIDRNKIEVDRAMAELKRLTHSGDEQVALGRLEQARQHYRSSFIKAAELVEGGEREAATRMLVETTFPALETLLAQTKRLAALQRQDIAASSRATQDEITRAHVIMLALGALAVLAAVYLTLRITDSITTPLHEAVSVAQSVAAGDLSNRIQLSREDEMGSLLQALGAMNAALAKTVGGVRVATDTIAQASREIATGNQDLSARTEAQASSLEQTASSMEALTETVKQNADNARQANQLVISASSVASRGGQVVAEVVTTMAAIKDSSRRIQDIIGVIDGIAFQTNILALNAAVEAARAGEQGRGFAVVAGEVRNLAQRAAAAAKEIASLIQDSVNKVDDGGQLVDEAGKTMELVVTSVRQVADIMSEITAASQEQRHGIEQVNAAINQMDEMTVRNAALVEQAAAAAQAMQDEAAGLAAAVAVFRLGQQAPGSGLLSPLSRRLPG